MFRIGTDIIRISRIEKSLEKKALRYPFLRTMKFFIQKKPKPLQDFLPQKEAYLKAKGTGINKNLIQ